MEQSHLHQLLSVSPKPVLTRITFNNTHYSLSLAGSGSLSPHLQVDQCLPKSRLLLLLTGGKPRAG